MSNKKDFIKKYKKLKKSQEDNYTYNDSKVMVSAKMHEIAESSVPKGLLKYLETSIKDAEMKKIRIQSGVLNVYEIEKGLYGAFLQDNDGQVVEKFENVTIPILAKTLMVKGYYTEAPIHPFEMAASEASEDYVESERTIAAEVAQKVIENYLDNMEPPSESKHPSYVRIKCGDFEFELKKSMQQFINDFRKNKVTSKEVRKALQAWKRNSKNAQEFKTDHEAAKALMSDWDNLSEEFCQIVHALNVRKNG